MKLIEAQVSDFKSVRFAHIRLEPKAGLIEVAGENGSGKSSLLSAIMVSLEGMANAPIEPVRRGSKRSMTELKFDTGLVVKRTIQATGGTILTVSRDGMKFAKPQEVIDEFFGRLAFDPYSFSKQKPKEQLQTLMQLVGLDFTADDQLRAEAMEERKAANKNAERLKLKIQGMAYHADAPDKEHSIADLSKELQRLDAVNNGNQLARHRLAEAEAGLMKSIESADIASKDASLVLARRADAIAEAEQSTAREVASLEQQIKLAKSRGLERVEGIKKKAAVEQESRNRILQIAREHMAKAKSSLEAEDANANNLADVDASDIQQQIALAEIVNKKVADNARRAEVLMELAEVQQNIEGLTDQIKSVDEHKRQCVAACQFPVTGLSLTDEGVTLNGMPYSNTCESEQIRASVLIGKATNPKMQLMFVREGGAFTDKGMKVLAKIAEENDLQLMVERPGAGGESAIVISEGKIVGAELELPED